MKRITHYRNIFWVCFVHAEDVPQYAGVIVYSLANIPLGFGAAAQGTERARDMDPTGIVVLHQADIGEYLREEATLT